jgi:subtilase family serine protease
VQGVVGLDSRPRYHPNLQHSFQSQTGGKVQPFKAAPSNSTGNAPGDWTVADYAKYYNVNPLYQKGFDGTGTHLGIVTLASFTPSDATAYWNFVGLKVLNRRIHEIHVDGGSGPPSDDAGSTETTLDVEQAGGLAPGAKIVVYEAPNTTQGFIDAFAEAINDNKVDTISTSWAIWEFFDLVAQGGGVSDPYNGKTVSAIQAYSELLVQAALQGQTVFVAAGDSGAYEQVREVPPPSWPTPKDSVVLSVSDPSAQQWITSIGGTTLAGNQVYGVSATQNLTINIAKEQAWSWSYLQPLCDALKLDPLACGIYSVGGGGGVSSFVPLPLYQVFVPGIVATEPGQTLLDYSQTPPQLITKLPAHHFGRNIPDISSNADPETGYQVWYTSDVHGPEVLTFEGGTSFGAPQFNGVTALYNQALGHRLGVMNFALYDLARFGEGYEGSKAPLKDITAGNNWFYKAHSGYDQTTGVGIPNFTNLLKAFK